MCISFSPWLRALPGHINLALVSLAAKQAGLVLSMSSPRLRYGTRRRKRYGHDYVADGYQYCWIVLIHRGVRPFSAHQSSTCCCQAFDYRRHVQRHQGLPYPLDSPLQRCRFERVPFDQSL
jgi:hypothetical protein